MKVLVACEESQAVCIEFRRKGHEAYSCDIQECSGGHPEWHIQGDAIEEAYSGKYDMMIGHPPILRRSRENQIKDLPRYCSRHGKSMEFLRTWVQSN